MLARSVFAHAQALVANNSLLGRDQAASIGATHDGQAHLERYDIGLASRDLLTRTRTPMRRISRNWIESLKVSNRLGAQEAHFSLRHDSSLTICPE